MIEQIRKKGQTVLYKKKDSASGKKQIQTPKNIQIHQVDASFHLSATI